jgi:hypothetical protein
MQFGTHCGCSDGLELSNSSRIDHLHAMFQKYSSSNGTLYLVRSNIHIILYLY